MTPIRSCVAAALTSIVLLNGSTVAQTATPTNYLDRVTRFADTMLRDGTDRYGREQSPLFANALTRDARPALVEASPKDKEWPPRFTALPNVFMDSDHAHKLSIAGADVGADLGLYQLLYDLSDVTGRPEYAKGADAALKWFLDRAPHPATQLLPWGEHTGWDFRKETYETGPDVWPDKEYQDKHEFQEQWDLWEKFATLPERGPAVLCEYAAALYRGHVYFEGGRLRFSRHGDLVHPNNKLAREDQGMFPRHGGYMIDAMSAAFAVSPDPKFKADMLAHLKAFADEWDKQVDEYGHIAYDLTLKDFSRGKNDAPSVMMRRAAVRIESADPTLAAHLRRVADRAYPVTPASKKAADLMSGDLKDRGIGKNEKHKQKPGYTPGWNLTGRVPRQYADAILTLIDAADAAESDASPTKTQYLERARFFADRAVDLFLEDGTGSPLPRMLDKHSPVVLADGRTTAPAFYHSYTGGDDLMYALLRLHVATGGK